VCFFEVRRPKEGKRNEVKGKSAVEGRKKGKGTR